jgi:hypothetical protein
MAGKILVESKNPISQSIEAVKALLSWRHMPTDPIPATIGFPGGAVVLVQSSKRDIYYTVTASDCSCPAKCYHPGQRCKHQKKFFATAEVQIPRDVIAKMPHVEMIIDAYAPDTTEGEVRYWQSKGELELIDRVGFRPVLAGE